MSTITTKDGTDIYFKDWDKGAPHGMCTTLKQQVNEDLLGFLRG